MTIHVLHAGDGYLYLIRSVATNDSRSVPGRSLSAYYLAAGQPHGRWCGSLTMPLSVDSVVTEEQMRSLFGEGLHPNAAAIQDAMIRDGASLEQAYRAVRLGRRFPVYGANRGLQRTINRAYREREQSEGRPLSAEEKLGVRQQVAAMGFARHNGRAPIDPIELESGERISRNAVAGYDLVFTPVKSVSVLWALGSAATRRQIYDSHQAAVVDAIDWLERNAAYTRTGTVGQAQIDTTGVIAAVFDHWDSRAGDPDLHTHVAVSNRVQGDDAKWRSLDGRALFAAAVSLSERYNTRIEDELRRRLAVTFEERGGAGADRRPIREISGVPSSLIEQFSKRRQDIERRYRIRLDDYRRQHGHEPPEDVRFKLYQEVTLSDRPEKELGRSLQQMITSWQTEAATALGTDKVTDLLERNVLDRVDQHAMPQMEDMANDVVQMLAASRSTWNVHHVRAEAQRRSRPIPSSDRDALVEQIVAAATDPTRSIRVESPRTVAEPPQLQRADGESVFVEHASSRFTTTEILDAEERIVATARVRRDPVVRSEAVRSAIDECEVDGRGLNDGQQRLVRAFCLSGYVVQLGLAPAGSGKTTTMRAVTTAWSGAGRRVIALAPSAAAAAVLATELGVQAETVAKFDHDQPELVPAALILIDEAGMAGTLILDRIVQRAQEAGAFVRLIGDDQQLGAVEAGGVIRQLAHDVGAVRMQQVVRFLDPAEAQATLQVRGGRHQAVDFYLAHDRVVAGTTDTVPEAAYDAWLRDTRAGHDSLLLAPSQTQVTALNAKARSDLVLEGAVSPDGVELRDGNVAGVGDRITSRRNERLLAVHAGRDWVKNGDSWRVDHVHEDGALTVTHTTHRGRVTLPPEYVQAEVELDYARTIRRSQGLTVDDAHLIVEPRMCREDLYVGLSRARRSTHLYVATMNELGPDHQPEVAGSAVDVLRMIIGRSGVELSASEAIREAVASLGDLRRMAVEYAHALDVQVGDRFTTAADRVRPGLTADPAWPSVTHRLHQAEAEAWTAEDILRAADQLRSWTCAHSLAEVMAHRLDLILKRGNEERSECAVPRWVAVTPPGKLPDPWDSYLPRRYSEMADRITTLVATAEQERTPWLVDIGDGPGRMNALREVVAYRSIYDVASENPLGAEPMRHTRQHHAWSEAEHAIRQSHATDITNGTGRLVAELESVRRSFDDAPTTADQHGPHRHL